MLQSDISTMWGCCAKTLSCVLSFFLQWIQEIVLQPQLFLQNTEEPTERAEDLTYGESRSWQKGKYQHRRKIQHRPLLRAKKYYPCGCWCLTWAMTTADQLAIVNKLLQVNLWMAFTHFWNSALTIKHTKNTRYEKSLNIMNLPLWKAPEEAHALAQAGLVVDWVKSKRLLVLVRCLRYNYLHCPEGWMTKLTTLQSQAMQNET